MKVLYTPWNMTLQKGRKSMKKSIAIILLAGCLTGCAGGPYVNRNVSQTQANRDWDECTYEASKAVQVNIGMSMSQVIGGSMRLNEVRGMCMNLRGYHQQ
jgi:hypothetical protein